MEKAKKSIAEKNEKLYNLIIANLALIAIATVTFVMTQTMTRFEQTACTVRKLFGIICPFCGGTRCVWSLVRLNIVDAFKYHPSTVILALYVLVVNAVCIYDIITKEKKDRIIYRVDVIVYLYLGLSLLQYAIRLYCILNNVPCSFMYLDI